MRRHVIIGHLGPLDRASIDTFSGEIVTRLDLLKSQGQLGHGIGRVIKDMVKLDLFPTEVGLDLLILAALVHAADTRISRKTESQDTWTREIHLVVPVSNLALWAGTSELLKTILEFLTGDRWVIEFKVRPRTFSRMIPDAQLDIITPSFDGLTLFSGGLDSLIGTIDLLESGINPLLVSHAGDSAASNAQNICFQALKAHYSDLALQRIRLWMNFPKGLVQDAGLENTTRGRSFLFFAIGIFVGCGLRKNFTLSVPENGFIALNVPLDTLRLGALSTRTTHPFYMARWNELLQKLGIPGKVENHYWNKTKGEMVRNCANPTLLRNIISNSLSCSSPTKSRWHGQGIEHCGYCLPCLIRRAAILYAYGQGADPTSYTLSDLTAKVLNSRKAEGQQIRSLRLAIERLRANPSLASLLIHKQGPLMQQAAHLSELADVYQRGLTEVAALLAGVTTQPK